MSLKNPKEIEFFFVWLNGKPWRKISEYEYVGSGKWKKNSFPLILREIFIRGNKNILPSMFPATKPNEEKLKKKEENNFLEKCFPKHKRFNRTSNDKTLPFLIYCSHYYELVLQCGNLSHKMRSLIHGTLFIMKLSIMCQFCHKFCIKNKCNNRLISHMWQ